MEKLVRVKAWTQKEKDTLLFMAREGSSTTAIANSLDRSESSVRVKMRALRASGELLDNKSPYRRRSASEIQLMLEEYVAGATHSQIAESLGRSIQSVQRGLDAHRRDWHRTLRAQVAKMRQQGVERGIINITIRDRFAEHRDD